MPKTLGMDDDPGGRELCATILAGERYGTKLYGRAQLASRVRRYLDPAEASEEGSSVARPQSLPTCRSPRAVRPRQTDRRGAARARPAGRDQARLQREPARSFAAGP